MQRPLVGVPTAPAAGCVQLLFPLNEVGMTALNAVDETIVMVSKLLPVAFMVRNSSAKQCFIFILLGFFFLQKTAYVFVFFF